MSRGGYTSAIDMWSLGCIFGELLQRTPRVGSASTPNLKVAPLFAIHAGIIKTPQLGSAASLDHFTAVAASFTMLVRVVMQEV